ncbi:MAG TPA: lmo0937 family membrane protein [Kofleriaceae bacterium]|jgi:hypothetical protein|nr:lmo0937 family membrane protein [Kofleriaceae bacterium]
MATSGSREPGREAVDAQDSMASAVARGLHYRGTEVLAMFLALAVILAIAWLMGFTVFHVASGAIHILLVVAVVVAIVHFVQGRRAPL